MDQDDAAGCHPGHDAALAQHHLVDVVGLALTRRPDAIALDAGSTDSGAAYLAKGVSKNDRRSVKRDLELLMGAQQAAGIPILIGTAGQAGGDLNVDWTRDIVLEIAREKGWTPKVALLCSEQPTQPVKQKLADGRISNLPPLGDLDEARIDSCLHIVALMGPEPYFAALEAGDDIVIGGRASDAEARRRVHDRDRPHRHADQPGGAGDGSLTDRGRRCAGRSGGAGSGTPAAPVAHAGRPGRPGGTPGRPVRAPG
ncbi:acyclic terpene utilization AtuA family protein [Streptomyces sp. SAI-229]|uniref:acyclic terpene utilization AtuA family protein n=1 Tax=Streptomyces sp. SAI-229 TaxID=3377731 RepID=UPI003C7B05CE